MSRKGSGGKRKTSLPAFGFADDLLKGSREGGAPDEAQTPEAQTPEAQTPANEANEKAAGKISLPAFGFAEDLLGKPGAAKKAASEPAAPPHPARSSKSAPPAADAKTRTEMEVDGKADGKADGKRVSGKGQVARGGVARGENRIFAFADSLEATSAEEDKRHVTLETWVTFTLAGETFAMPVDPVREILRISTITRVPHAPHPIRGVTNLRGRVIPVIDLRVRIELAEGDLTKASRIIVVGSRNRLLGLLVDGVHQVVHLDVDRIQPPPEDVMTIQSDYISGVYQTDGQLLLLLDVDRALIIREMAPSVREAGDSPAAAAEA